MRLWSLHPMYLDSKGLVAGWREALLAQKVLQGATHGYRSHPQLQRFREAPNPLAAMAAFLRGIQAEATSRGYSFDAGKIVPGPLLAAEADIAEPGPPLRALGFPDARARAVTGGRDGGIVDLPSALTRQAGDDAAAARPLLPRIPVTEGQVAYEAELLLFKLRMRAPQMVDAFQERIRTDRVQLHPLFERVPGPVAPWEKVRSDL